MDEALRASMAAVPVNGRSDTVTYEVTLPKKVGPMPDQDSSSNYSWWEITMCRKYNLQEVQRSEEHGKEDHRDAISKIQTVEKTTQEITWLP